MIKNLIPENTEGLGGEKPPKNIERGAPYGGGRERESSCLSSWRLKSGMGLGSLILARAGRGRGDELHTDNAGSN